MGVLVLSFRFTPAGAAPLPTGLWKDATRSTIGTTAGWTNKVELADLDGDGRVDIVFANGGDHHTAGTPEANQVFLNRGAGAPFKDASAQVFGSAVGLTRVVKARDLDGDGVVDLIVGNCYQTQSRLYLGTGGGHFQDVTDTHLPQLQASVADIEVGDVDGDGDLDLVLADWGAGPGAGTAGVDASRNAGGRTMLWLNDGKGHFTDATATQMPTTMVRWSWDLELVDVDNDFDLDVVVSAKGGQGSFLFVNDGAGHFTDVTAGKMPQYSNNYEFEPIDLDGDSFFDLITLNDGPAVSDPSDAREHVFKNDGKGGFTDATPSFWPDAANPGYDDNMVVVLDYDSDGDPDFLIGSLSGPDRLLVNDVRKPGGVLQLAPAVFVNDDTPGTLGIQVADLDGDHRLDVVQSQGEVAFPDKVFLATAQLPPDTAPPIILVDRLEMTADGLRVRARVHDNKTPVAPHDFQAVVVRVTSGGATSDTPMVWYGEALFRANLTAPAAGATGQVCATDAAGNQACSTPFPLAAAASAGVASDAGATPADGAMSALPTAPAVPRHGCSLGCSARASGGASVLVLLALGLWALRARVR
jgi:hypothetical protein